MRNILGIDVGGTGIKGALVDVEQGQLVTDRHLIATPKPATPKAVAEVLAEMVHHFEYEGVLGIGFPAAIVQGVVQTAANIDPSWIGVPIERLVQEKTGCSVVVINDADAAGLAEMRFGAGKGSEGVVFVITLGTGIGTGMFVDGKLVPNTELGHVYLPGQSYDAEHMASEGARVRENLKWKAWASRLDAYLDHMEGLFWPTKMIIGGGVSEKYEKFIPYLTVRAEVVPAVLRNHAGIIGAAMAGAEK